MNDKKSILDVKNFNLHIEEHHILKDINMSFFRKKVTAIMGPSGCGKSTLVRSMNRLNDQIPGIKMDREMSLYKKNLLEMNPILVRRKVAKQTRR